MPRLGAVLERNVKLDRNSIPLHSSNKYVPLAIYCLYEYFAGAAYGYETATELLEDNGTDTDEITPGEPIEP